MPHPEGPKHSLLTKFIVRSILVLSFSILFIELLTYNEASNIILDLMNERQRTAVRTHASSMDLNLKRLVTDTNILASLPATEAFLLNNRYGLVREAEENADNIRAFIFKQNENATQYNAVRVCDADSKELFRIIIKPDPNNPINDSRNCSRNKSLNQVINGRYLVADSEIRRSLQRIGFVEIVYDLKNDFALLSKESLFDSGHMEVYSKDGVSLINLPESIQLPFNLDSLFENDDSNVTGVDHEGRLIRLYRAKLTANDFSIYAIVYHDEMFAPLKHTLLLVSVSVFIVFIIEVGLLTVFVNRLIIHPIKELINATRMVFKGDFKHTIITHSDDEIGLLGTSFNQMIEHIQVTISNLESEKRKHAQSETRLQSILDNSSSSIYIKDLDGRYQMVNKAFLSLFQWKAEGVVGLKTSDLFNDEISKNTRLNDEQVIAQQKALQFDETLVDSQGNEHVSLSVKFPLYDHTNQIYAICGISHDITERTKFEKELKRLNEKLNLIYTVFEKGQESLLISDANRIIIDANPAFEKHFGYTREEIIGNSSSILSSDTHSEAFYQELWNTVSEKGSWHGELCEKNKDGTLVTRLATISAITNDDGQCTHYAASFSDITELKAQEEKLKQLAHFDNLTGLANRTLLEILLNKTILTHDRRKSLFAVFFIDLDNFKYVNDSFGHDQGDDLLVKLSQRLQNVIRESDIVARLGGDEFIILLDSITHRNDVTYVAEKIHQEICRPFIIQEREIYLSTSTGIAIYPEDGTTVSELLKNADLAMYSAKESGKNKYCYYSENMNRLIERRLNFEQTLREAMKNNEFLLHYQPQVNLFEKEIIKAEVLVRWQNKDGTLVYPNDFISVAEDTGLIIPLGYLIVDLACQGLRQINQLTNNQASISINLSARQFRHHDLPERLLDIAERYHIPANNLEFEITESIIMEDYQVAKRILKRMKDIGFKLSLDDFGTGYSSLGHLKEFPLDTVKLDRKFIIEMENNHVDQVIIRSVIQMAEAMSLNVVCEGVETETQLNLLKSIGGKIIQGYYLSKPLSFENYLDYLKNPSQ